MFRFFFSFLHNFLCFLNSSPSGLWSLPVCASSSEWSLSLIQAPSSCPFFVIFFLFFLNGCRNPLQEFVKRMSTSVSLFFWVFCETDIKIRFRNLWNGCQHPFRYFFWFFYETDVKIHFRNLWNGFRHPFRYFFFVFFWNGYRNPFQEFVKRISKSVWVFLRRRRIIDPKRLRYCYVSHLTTSHVIQLEINIIHVLTSDSFVDILVISCFIKLLLLQEKKLA